MTEETVWEARKVKRVAENSQWLREVVAFGTLCANPFADMMVSHFVFGASLNFMRLFRSITCATHTATWLKERDNAICSLPARFAGWCGVMHIYVCVCVLAPIQWSQCTLWHYLLLDYPYDLPCVYSHIKRFAIAFVYQKVLRFRIRKIKILRKELERRGIEIMGPNCYQFYRFHSIK